MFSEGVLSLSFSLLPANLSTCNFWCNLLPPFSTFSLSPHCCRRLTRGEPFVSSWIFFFAYNHQLRIFPLFLFARRILVNCFFHGAVKLYVPCKHPSPDTPAFSSIHHPPQVFSKSCPSSSPDYSSTWNIPNRDVFQSTWLTVVVPSENDVGVVNGTGPCL